MQVKQLLTQQFPGVEVLGSTYPLSAGRQLASKALGAAQLAGFGLVLLGDRAFEAAGVPAPAWYARVQQARPTFAIGVWLFGNMAQSAASSTGAFEIYFDGRMVRDLNLGYDLGDLGRGCSGAPAAGRLLLLCLPLGAPAAPGATAMRPPNPCAAAFRTSAPPDVFQARDGPPADAA